MNTIKKLLMVGLLASTAIAAGQAWADPPSGAVGEGVIGLINESEHVVTVEINPLGIEDSDDAITFPNFGGAEWAVDDDKTMTETTRYANNVKSGALGFMLYQNGDPADGFNVTKADGTDAISVGFTVETARTAEQAVSDGVWYALEGAHFGLVLDGKADNITIKATVTSADAKAAESGTHTGNVYSYYQAGYTG